MSKEKRNMKAKKNNKGDNATKYGEFVSSYFAWLSPSEQKKRGQKLQDITKNSE
jgi:hypothetical protein